MITEAIQITGQTCSAGTSTLYVKNIGTEALTTTDFTVEKDGTPITPTIAGTLTQGGGITITDATCGADTYCRYTIIVGGRVYRADVNC